MAELKKVSFWWNTYKGRENLGELGVDRRIRLKM
jgi:hypothetical protein